MGVAVVGPRVGGPGDSLNDAMRRGDLLGECTACHAQIVWIRMKSGRWNPTNPPVKAVVTNQGELIRGRESHYATCPDAVKFRKPKPEQGELV